MKISWPSRALSTLCSACFCLISAAALAEVRVFTVTYPQSFLTFSGNFAGIAGQQQSPGSLTGRYTGTIVVDLTGSTIRFTGGSSVVASNTGTYRPMPGGVAGMAPANYGVTGSGFGGLLTGDAAVRSILLDMTNVASAISGTNFPAQNITFIVSPSALSAFDYRTMGLSSSFGTQPLASNSTNNVATSGIISTQGANIVLTLPVKIAGFATISTPNDVQYQLTGQILASAPVAGPPKITDIHVGGGQIHFTILTGSNLSYSILGSSNLVNWTSTNDQFIATNSIVTRSIPLPIGQPRQFFRIRQN